MDDENFDNDHKSPEGGCVDEVKLHAEAEVEMTPEEDFPDMVPKLSSLVPQISDFIHSAVLQYDYCSLRGVYISVVFTMHPS